MSEVVSLNKKRQSKFAKKAAKLKSKFQNGEVTISQDAPSEVKHNPNQRGLIYLGHIPHGFYEDEMRQYFSQFGKVTNVRVCRSFQTGKSKGYGFVEFLIPEVAEVAAETMHNYLMFNRRLEAKYIPPEKQHENIFKGESWAEKSTPYKAITKVATQKRNLNISSKKRIIKAKQRISKLNNTSKKLKALGITFNVRPVDVPEEIKLPDIQEPKKSKRIMSKVLATEKTNNKSKVSVIDKTKRTKNISEKVITEATKAAKKIVKMDEPKTKNVDKLSIVQEPRNTRSVKKLTAEPKKAVKMSNGFICENDTSIVDCPKKRRSSFVVESELDTTVEDSPKKKRVVKKKSNVVMKQMSDKLKMATMSILNSDLVVKKKGKIMKKNIKKK